MDRLNNMAAHFVEKERRKLDKIAQEKGGMPDMSFEEVRLSCMENNGYETPELNDKLYLHFRGFKRIENLDRFVACKAIWLDSNGFDKIENLNMLVELRCLYLSKNLINRIDGLDNLKFLTILDLSNNRVNKIENLSSCPILQTVNLSHNYIVEPSALEHLKECPSITNLDITHNKLEANEEFINIFKAVPNIVALSINGNEVTKLPLFRKRMVANNLNMGYLDRPVDEQERLFATAFMEGGADAEAAARQKWKDDQNTKRINEANVFREWQAEQARIREAARREGRPVHNAITPFTPEEEAQRAAEAQAAGDAERAMLGLGIERLGTRFHQIDENAARGVDPLEAATEQLLAEQRRRNQRHEIEELEEAEVVTETAVDQTDIVVELEEESVATPRSSGVEESKSIAIEEEEVEEVESEAVIRQREENERVRHEELREQREREMRVDESFAIYKKQLAQKSQSASSSGSAEAKSVWDTPVKAPVVVERLYWTESMDIELAKLVKVCVFDFDDIAERMQGSSGLTSPALLTNEACRIRWSQLDASNWAEMTPGYTPLDTVFKVCINPTVLGTGHGAQPSFNQLASLSAGSMPTYLKAPALFPSVQDNGDEDSDLDLD